MKTLVYCINFPNGKRYVGITTRTLDERMTEHFSRARNGYKNKLYSALKKYEFNVNCEILEECVNSEIAKNRECFYVSYFDTKASGYNMTDGGDGINGHVFTDSQKLKMSLSRKKNIMTEEHKKNIGAANTGKRKSYAKQIKRTDISTGDIKIYSSFQDVKKENFDKACVYKVIQGKRKQHKGFFWEMVK